MENIADREKLIQTITSIWKDILKQDTISLSDNFFDLGGDSILAIEISAKAREKGIKLEPEHIFEYQTIEDLSKAL